MIVDDVMTAVDTNEDMTAAADHEVAMTMTETEMIDTEVEVIDAVEVSELAMEVEDFAVDVMVLEGLVAMAPTLVAVVNVLPDMVAIDVRAVIVSHEMTDPLNGTTATNAVEVAVGVTLIAITENILCLMMTRTLLRR